MASNFVPGAYHNCVKGDLHDTVLIHSETVRGQVLVCDEKHTISACFRSGSTIVHSRVVHLQDFVLCLCWRK